MRYLFYKKKKKFIKEYCLKKLEFFSFGVFLDRHKNEYEIKT